MKGQRRADCQPRRALGGSARPVPSTPSARPKAGPPWPGGDPLGAGKRCVPWPGRRVRRTPEAWRRWGGLVVDRGGGACLVLAHWGTSTRHRAEEQEPKRSRAFASSPPPPPTPPTDQTPTCVHVHIPSPTHPQAGTYFSIRPRFGCVGRIDRIAGTALIRRVNRQTKNNKKEGGSCCCCCSDADAPCALSIDRTTGWRRLPSARPADPRSEAIDRSIEEVD